MVSIMPCTAKKAEAIRPNSFTDGEQDTDIVITTTELLRMIDNFGLDFATLDPEACDMPFGFGSGGGVIFGVTGGVTEAVLRRLSPDHSKEAMHEIAAVSYTHLQMYPLRQLCTCLRGTSGNRSSWIRIPWNRGHGYACIQ